MKMKYVWDKWDGDPVPPEGDVVKVTFSLGEDFETTGISKHYFDWKHINDVGGIVSYCIAVPDDGEEL